MNAWSDKLGVSPSTLVSTYGEHRHAVICAKERDL